MEETGQEVNLVDAEEAGGSSAKKLPVRLVKEATGDLLEHAGLPLHGASSLCAE